MKQTNGQEETEIKVELENKGTVNKNEVVLTKKDRRLILCFSYQTIVSFSYSGENGMDDATIINLWSTTTGKYLNELQPNHNLRVSEEEFNKRLANVFKLFGG